ncbi:MAG: low molecular weight phosphotyrosine protein phosphatase [Phycisphaerales bacterium]|nr:low molecular weight phosphotyrosine protein phosphatase [Phycisphaerales bacterium]
MSQTTGLLFVCLGNICRSPLAEGVFLHLAEQRAVRDRFLVDSCGTGRWHAGERPDPRALAVARRHGVELPSIARQVDPGADFARFDMLLAMDWSNRRNLIRLGAPDSRVRLVRSFDPTLDTANEESLDVPDPYYGGDEGFESVFQMLTRACNGLLDTLLAARAQG